MATPPELSVRTELSRRPAQEVNDALALTKEQQALLNQHKVQVRIETEYYLRSHPEVAVMLSTFIHDVLLERPQSIQEFAAEFFTDPTLPETAKEILKQQAS